PELRRQLRVPGLKEADERALAHRLADRLDFRELVAAAEHIEEAGALPRRAAEHPLLVKNDGPGNDREEREEQKNYLGGCARPRQQPDDAGSVGRGLSLGLQQQGKVHRSKRAQTGLRNIAVRRWDSAEWCTQ